jgi:hypothetical protein
VDRFMIEFCQTFKQKLTSMQLKLFYEIERWGTLPKSFYKASITLIQEHTQKRKL